MEWDWNNLSTHKKLTIDFIEKFRNKGWCWDYIFYNINIKENFNVGKYREYLAAYKIQQWWKHITITPIYKIGRKFINKKYDNLFDENEL